MFAKRLKNLTPYVPGEQPRDGAYIKLNTNENPYPPSPRIAEFLREYDCSRLRLYPDPTMRRLREALAWKEGVPVDKVFVGNGSDEVLSLAFYSFFDEDNGMLLFPEHTYSFYPVYGDFYGIPYRRVPLNRHFGIDLKDYENQGRSISGVIFPNPNAPTGMALPLEEIRRFLQGYPADRVLIIDEAYTAFGAESAVSLIDDYPNLLVVRTLSKSHSLASLRVGYALGSPGLIEALFTAKDSFNSYPVDEIGQRIGEIAVRDAEYNREMVGRIVATRERTARILEERGWTLLPSQSNFLFIQRPCLSGETIYRKLRAEKILVRYFDKEGIRRFVRVTIGTEEEMDRFLEVLQRLFP